MASYGSNVPLMLAYAIVAASAAIDPATANCTSSFHPRVLATPISSGVAFYEYDEDPNTGIGGRLAMFDFTAGERTELSASWGLDSPRNPHVSPNRQYVLFSAANLTANRRDIYIWPFGSAQPVQLSNSTFGGKLEDPNFSADGKTIVAKVDTNYIEEFTLDYANPATPTMTLAKILPISDTNQFSAEKSGPWLSPDNTYVTFYRGNATAGEAAKLFNTQTNQETALPLGSIAPSFSLTYYPELPDLNIAFFVGNTSTANNQIYMQSAVLHKVVQLPFNYCQSNNSDPAQVSGQLMIFSSTALNNSYQAYLGDMNTGDVYYLPRAFNGVGNQATTNVVGTTYTPFPMIKPPS